MRESDAPRIHRPLPQPSLATRSFWEAGSDGVLRFQQCDSCAEFVHPPQAVCPECHSDRHHLEAVPGTATVIAVTVNHQMWSADFEPPYAIVVVEPDGVPGVRFTSNVVGAEPSEITVGCRVRVTFERNEGFGIPLFTLIDEPSVSVPAPKLPPAPRLPASPRRFEHEVAITGVGQSDVGRRLMRDPLLLTVQACLAAIEDAGLDISDIDGLSTYPGPGQNIGMSEGGVIPLEEALRIRPMWVNGAGDTPGQTGSIVAAMLAVSSGLCRHVLCFRTLTESTATELMRTGQMTAPRMDAAGSFYEWRAPFGAFSAANWIALQASNYGALYGDVKEALGHIAVTTRAHAALNPEALYREPFSLDEYMASRMISTPLGLLDCDVPCDGAVAIVVSARDMAGDLRQPPVFVDSVGTQVNERLSWDQGTMSHLPQSLSSSAQIWTRTGLRPSDVDVALLYDGFTFNALSWLEGLGFCGLGEGPAFINAGATISLGGALPMNPHGGQLSAGRLHGYGFVREAVLQLRGSASGRQVEGAQVAVTTAGGGIPSGTMLLTNQDTR